jgi:hypothetical protein
MALPCFIDKIISGGQTGADRAALDFAISHKIPYGGWVPKGRTTEDGTLPEKYILQEMPTGEYSKRTEQNILDSDGTLIVSHAHLTGGSGLMEYLAEKHGKPCVHIDLSKVATRDAALIVNIWIQRYKIKTLNVAGPRASKDPKIYQATFELLEVVFIKKTEVEIPSSGISRINHQSTRRDRHGKQGSGIVGKSEKKRQ